MTQEPVWVPRKIFTSHQLTIPVQMLRELDIGVDDTVYVAMDRSASQIVIVPKEVHDRRLR